MVLNASDRSVRPRSRFSQGLLLDTPIRPDPPVFHEDGLAVTCPLVRGMGKSSSASSITSLGSGREGPWRRRLQFENISRRVEAFPASRQRFSLVRKRSRTEQVDHLDGGLGGFASLVA